jgi:hypothetical protein
MILGSYCACADVEPGTVLRERVIHNEALWNAGRSYEYYQNAATLTKSIMAASAMTNVDEVAAALLNNLVSKEVNVKEADERFDVDDLSVMERLALHLISARGITPEERPGNARLLSRYLGRIRSEIIHNYKDQPVTENVMPPLDTLGPVFSGISPDAIKDPVARAKYEDAIRENHQNAVINARQTFLARSDAMTGGLVISYLVETFRTGALSPDDLADCIKSAHLTEDEKKEVASEIVSK